MDKDKIVKKTLYEFKRFARSEGFWEEYKQLSCPLKYRTKFIDVINKHEPVELIQSTSAFCYWPNWQKWHERSVEWANICISKGLYFNLDKALDYIIQYF
jgi:hypothetical protein